MTRVSFGCGIAVLLLAPFAAAAAPAVREAEVRVVFASPTSCTVDLALTVDAVEVEHRIDVAEGADIHLLGVAGARVVGEPTDVGRTRALVVEPGTGRYSLRYAASQPPHRAGRCPLWIPTIPTEGRGRRVRIVVRIPEGATARGTMPSFDWAGGEGTAAIGHLPAFVRVPHALPGEPVPWDMARVMDGVSIAALALASLAWARRSRRRGLAP
jgi:hypothetical protein